MDENAQRVNAVSEQNMNMCHVYGGLAMIEMSYHNNSLLNYFKLESYQPNIYGQCLTYPPEKLIYLLYPRKLFIYLTYPSGNKFPHILKLLFVLVFDILPYLVFPWLAVTS